MLKADGDVMAKQTVTRFKPYPFYVGQKINIADGPRKGDWLVTDITAKKVTLQCPISMKKFTWDQFCYFVEDLTETEWPSSD
jgi:hypothetical protein